MTYTVRDGWALGIAFADTAVAVRWYLRTGKVETFPQFDIRADDVKAHGWQVGSIVASQAFDIDGQISAVVRHCG